MAVGIEIIYAKFHQILAVILLFFFQLKMNASTLSSNHTHKASLVIMADDVLAWLNVLLDMIGTLPFLALMLVTIKHKSVTRFQFFDGFVKISSGICTQFAICLSGFLRFACFLQNYLAFCHC